MTKMIGKQLSITLAAAALSAAALGNTAFAGEYYVPAAAPITYKMANPNMMPGYAPQMQAPIQGIAQATGPAATFDASRVDPTLYAHQKVGNPYTVMSQTYRPAHNPMYDMVGTASWYGDKYHGKLTASGETYDKNAMTAAHKTLPLGSLVIVTNIATGQSLTLRINDRGPFVGNRLIDLSEAAATALGYQASGLGDVRVQYAGPAAPLSAPAPSQQAYAAPAPQMPQYVQPAPQQFAQVAPAPSAPQTYEPLRTLPEQFAPQMPAPHAPVQQQTQPQYNVPNLTAPMMPQTALPQTPIAIPEAHVENHTGDNTLTTLTIKGPVHMAKHASNKGYGELILVSYRTPK